MQTPFAGQGSNPPAPPPEVPAVACPPVAEAPAAEPAVPPLDVPAVLGAPPLFEFPPGLGLPALPKFPPFAAAPPEFAPPGPALPPFAVAPLLPVAPPVTVVPPLAGAPPAAMLPPLELPASGVVPPLPASGLDGDDEHATRNPRRADQTTGRDARLMTIFNAETSASTAGRSPFLSPPSAMLRWRSSRPMEKAGLAPDPCT